MLAGFTGSARLAIEQSEAEQLANAAAAVARHYDIPDIAPQTIDWTNLAMALGMVYGTRIAAAWREARDAEGRAEGPAPAASSPAGPPQRPVVVPMPAPGQADRAPGQGNQVKRQPPDPTQSRTAHVEGLGDLTVPGYGQPR